MLDNISFNFKTTHSPIITRTIKERLENSKPISVSDISPKVANVSVNSESWENFFHCLLMGMSLKSSCNFAGIDLFYIENILHTFARNPRLEPHATIAKKIRKIEAAFELRQVEKLDKSGDWQPALKLLERRRPNDYAPLTKVDLRAQLLTEVTDALREGSVDFEFIRQNYPDIAATFNFLAQEAVEVDEEDYIIK